MLAVLPSAVPFLLATTMVLPAVKRAVVWLGLHTAVGEGSLSVQLRQHPVCIQLLLVVSHCRGLQATVGPDR